MSRLAVAAVLLVLLLAPVAAYAIDPQAPASLGATLDDVVQNTSEPEVTQAVRLLVLMTALTVLPGLLLLMTPFTRFLIVFALLRQALGLQQSPPNQVLVALSILLSLVVMQPTLEQVNNAALQPYLAGQITTGQAYDRAVVPLREHMVTHTRRSDLGTAIRIAKLPKLETIDQVPTTVVMTGYLLSELHAAFVAGVKVYVPFLVVDLVVSSALLGMGMMMLPPVVISLPFKLLVFVLMDGWTLIIVGLARGAA